MELTVVALPPMIVGLVEVLKRALNLSELQRERFLFGALY